MTKSKSFAERIHYDGTKHYTVKQGRVAYLDTSSLKRPFTMPRLQSIFMFVIVAIGIAVGVFMLDKLVFSQWREAAQAEQAVVANLDREASIESVPVMTGLINCDDKTVKATLKQTGDTFCDASIDEDSTSMKLYRVPSDMDSSEAASWYEQGINSLSAEQASKLLTGSWVFTSDTTNGTSRAVHYADFKVSGVDEAVQNALQKQGFDSQSITEAGVDDSGNTYASGTVEVEGHHCIWKISALPLEEIYSFVGFPENAAYVGVRITAQ